MQILIYSLIEVNKYLLPYSFFQNFHVKISLYALIIQGYLLFF